MTAGIRIAVINNVLFGWKKPSGGPIHHRHTQRKEKKEKCRTDAKVVANPLCFSALETNENELGNGDIPESQVIAPDRQVNIYDVSGESA